MADELTGNSGKTAISRSKISAPMRYILGINPPLKKVFHQGPGREDNPDREKLKSIAYGKPIEYDPEHGPDDKSVLRQENCDQAVSIYVLNVLPPKARRRAILDIYHTLKSGGVAYIAVRSERDISQSCDNWEKHEDGYAVSRGKSRNFQKGYTRESLREELRKEFVLVEVFDEGGFILAVVTGKANRR